MPGIELHAIARIGKDFGHRPSTGSALLSHGVLQIVGGSVAVGSVGLGIGTAFAMQKATLASLQPSWRVEHCRLATDVMARAGCLRRTP